MDRKERNDETIIYSSNVNNNIDHEEKKIELKIKLNVKNKNKPYLKIDTKTWKNIIEKIRKRLKENFMSDFKISLYKKILLYHYHPKKIYMISYLK